ncbi:MAG TPA: helix-turn-helix transcriptional regulator [Verrucomicrobiae bacterium]|jgi:transcriptional regulator with XRE-family HTH domain|nr:helix-turn-helix transcriptional regulator [Verrucomicrobiae bacterium]
METNNFNNLINPIVNDSDVTKQFGLAIRSFRKTQGVSQEELAFRSGLHRTYISDVERGTRNISLRSIQNLAKALKLPLYMLFQSLENLPEPTARLNNVN